MKIAVIASSYVPSNTANSIQVIKVCQALKQAGADVHLWVPVNPDSNSQQLHNSQTIKNFYGIKKAFSITRVKENLRYKRYDFALKALREARGWGADLIYTWMPQAAFLGIHFGIPIALELHMMPSGKFGLLLLRRIAGARRKKLFLIITQALRNKMADRCGLMFRDDEVQIAPMGSEPERYEKYDDAAQCREKIGLPEGFTAAYTGHLYPGRGMEILVALAKAYQQVNFLWIGGKESDVDLWKQKINQAGLKNVTLTGFIENSELPPYQAAADVLLMPYGRNVGVSGHGDTADVCSPMKMFDYLSAGRVILSSDLPVLREVLNDGNARFAAADDAEDWVRAFGALIDDEEGGKTLAAQAKTDSRRFTWLSRAQQVLAYFEEDD